MAVVATAVAGARLTCRHTEQQSFSPEESTRFSAVRRILEILSTEALARPFVPPVSKMSVASRKGVFLALICGDKPRQWRKIIGKSDRSSVCEYGHHAVAAKMYTWLCTALCTAGPTSSRTSLPLSRLAMMSICDSSKMGNFRECPAKRKKLSL